MAIKKKKTPVRRKGVRIDFIAKERLYDKSFNQKFNMIMEKVKKRGIVVLEESLTHDEKTRLIEKSLNHVTTKFPGIEFAGFDSKPTLWSTVMKRVTGRERKEGMVIVGPTDIIQNLEQHRDTISFLAKL